MQFWESNNLPQIPVIISVLEEKEYRKYNKKGQLGKIWIPTSLQTESSRKQSAWHPPHFLASFSSVISWSGDWACDFKFYKCNIIRKSWRKYANEYQHKQVTHAKNSYLIYLSNTYFFLGKVGGEGREEEREKTCILENKYNYIISTNPVFFPKCFF